MYKISKSKYTSFVTCPKQFWLNCFKPELIVIDTSIEARFEQGNEAGMYAHGLFDGTVDTTARKPDGRLDIDAMVKKTAELVKNNCPAIAEAAFSSDDLYCAVDILKNNGDGTWDLYEVKSSTGRKLIYLYDIAFQQYALTACGIKVRACHLAYINNEYVRNGEIEPHKLFTIEEVTDLLPEFAKDIPQNIAKAQAVHGGSEPKIDISENCSETYKCSFHEYCFAHLPSPSVFDLYGSGFSKIKKFECYRNGIISFDDIRKSKISLKEKQQRQLDFYLDNKPVYIDKPAVREFLSGIKFPMYFLDFETYMSAIPPFDGIRPYQQVPFQYSLHILSRDGSLQHKEFLADENKNEWRALAERLAQDIPADGGSVISYNASFENTRLKEMADAFPEFAHALHGIIFRMADLYDVFRGGMVYKKEMGGSFSIKKVLPALCPSNPALDYHALNDVHNGGEAMTAFLELKNQPPDIRAKIRQSLLEYCGLDTMAMVEIYRALCSHIEPLLA